MVHDNDAYNAEIPALASALTHDECEAIWASLRAARCERVRLDSDRSWRRRANARSSRFRPTQRAGAGARP